MKLGGPLNVKT